MKRDLVIPAKAKNAAHKLGEHPAKLSLEACVATLTLILNSKVLEAARVEADRRQITLDQMVEEYLSTIAPSAPVPAENENLIRLLYEDRLGHVDCPLTREEIYAERTWPRS